ncbi:hypothetical protein [Spongiactinospora sp. 9N601]|uniref:hypothetical protein n=1 Tax=Spongiactinospora sp. 9N601 TaxID=3375149 RepID=UPI00379A31F7
MDAARHAGIDVPEVIPTMQSKNVAAVNGQSTSSTNVHVVLTQADRLPGEPPRRAAIAPPRWLPERHWIGSPVPRPSDGA